MVLKWIIGGHLLLFQTMNYNYYWLLSFENDLWDSFQSVLKKLFLKTICFKLSQKKSKVFERSIKLAPTIMFSPKALFHLLIMINNDCYTLLVSLSFMKSLTLSWRRPLSYRNQCIDLQSKSVDCFLYDYGLRLEKVKLIIKDYVKYLGHMGQKINRSVILLVHTIKFFKNWSHFSRF